jgi:hypothetical protein
MEMLPDFLGMVERVFCWVFCKKWWVGCGFKRGRCGFIVVNLWLVFTRVASLPLEIQIQGFFASLRMTTLKQTTAVATATADPLWG